VPLRAVARVNVAAIERNAARLRSALAGSAELCVVVKADGYGHGAAAAARAAQVGGATWLAVATAREARDLRAAGLAGRVVVLGALSGEEIDVALAADAEVVAWREAFVAGLASRAGGRRVRVHVKLDSGMGRLGTRDPGEATAVAQAVAAAGPLELAGAMTHFATADHRADAFFDEQLARFRAWALPLRAAHPGIVLHAANSAALLRDPAGHFDLVRAGIAVYGMDPFGRDPAEHGLEPALELASYVAEIKRCGAGESAGYGRRFIAARDTVIATVPIGYGDGVRRGLTNNADVLVRGRRRPLVGTVSMDNVTLDLGAEGGGVGRDDEAVLIGARGGERILAEEVARRLDTINYEVTCALSARVPRLHHRDGERVAE
jgi:alanine racemase